MICYLSFYSIPIPSNAEIYLKELAKIIDLQFLNPDAFIRKIIPTWNPIVLNIAHKHQEASVWNDLSAYFSILAVLFVVIICMTLLSIHYKLRD